LALVAVPASAAQSVADRLVAAGVDGILNFAPVTLNLPATVSHVGDNRVFATPLESPALSLSSDS